MSGQLYRLRIVTIFAQLGKNFFLTGQYFFPNWEKTVWFLADYLFFFLNQRLYHG